MPRNFYYRKQAEIVTGSANLAAKLVAEGAGLGVAPAQISAFGALDTSLQDAWSGYSDPDTRSRVSVEALRLAIKNMRDSAIALNMLIRQNPAVTDAQLISLGLLPRTTPAPIPPEMTPPVVEVVSVNGRLVTILVRQAGVDGKARPNGSAGAQIFTFAGTSAPTNPDEYKFQGLSSKSKDTILFGNEIASGSTVWIAAAWVSRRGQRGFACTPVSVTIQGGPILAMS